MMTVVHARFPETERDQMNQTLFLSLKFISFIVRAKITDQNIYNIQQTLRCKFKKNCFNSLMS